MNRIGKVNERSVERYCGLFFRILGSIVRD